MSFEGQFTAFTRAIEQYFVITTFTGAVRFVFLHQTMAMREHRMNASNTGTGDKAKYFSLVNIFRSLTWPTGMHLSSSVRECHDIT